MYQYEDNPVYEIESVEGVYNEIVRIDGQNINPVCLELVKRPKFKIEKNIEKLKEKIKEILEDF